MILETMFALAMLAPMQPPPVTPSQRLGFDYLDADLKTYAVTKFESQTDSGPWVDLGLPVGTVLADTIAGGKTYSVAPALAPGAHTISFRACNVVSCSTGTAPFAFSYVIQPPNPSGVRVIGPGE